MYLDTNKLAFTKDAEILQATLLTSLSPK